jgi:UDP-2-acetamido-3-amino-2,3-dideoxy-glucuronate N-acetyltransferase
MNKLKIGVIGCGNWGKNIVHNLLELNVLNKVYDANKVSLQNLPISDSYKSQKIEDIIENETIDAVVICTPPITHKDLALRTLKNHKHVYIEKPFCLSLEEADEIIATAKDSKKIVFIGHLLNYHNGFIGLKNEIKNNQIGNIVHIKANRMHFGVIRKFESVIYDLACHDISMILGITNDLPINVSVNALFKNSTHIPDSINAILKFKHNLTAMINVDWMSPYKEHRFSVLGSKGSLIFDDTKDWKEKLCINHSLINDNLNVIKGDSKFIDLKAEQPLKKELVNFLDCINKNIQPLTNHEEGLRVQKVMKMIEDHI